MYKKLAFIAYSVKDVPGAVKFYRDVVGWRQGESFGDHWVEFDVGDVTFGVGNGETIGIMPGSCTTAAFEVDDIVGERDRLVKRGVKVSDVSDSPKCRSCFVSDPEGNRFALHQIKA